MKEKLHHIETNELYKVDSLTHSIPYLIPSAAQLLDTIGSNFLDSLTAKGLNPNKVIVTSNSTQMMCETPAPPPLMLLEILHTSMVQHSM